MNSRYFSLSAAALLAAGTLALSGCGGGSSSSSTNGGGTTPPASLTAAETQLNTLVRGTQPLTVSNLNTLAGQFSAARQAAPTNKDAQFGYAVSEAALASAQVANLTGSAVPAARRADAETAKASRVSGLAQMLILWKMPAALGTGASWPRATDFVPTTRGLAQPLAASTSLTPAQVQAALATLDTTLAGAEQALNVVLADPNYTYTLADPSKPSDTAATVKVGHAEVQVFAAVLSTLRAISNAGTAYSADTGSFDFNAAVPDSLLAQTTIAPSSILPAAPFGTLNADGKTRLATVETELNSTATNAVAAIQGVEARSNAGYLLDPGTVVTTDQLNSVSAQITQYRAYLTGPQPISLTLYGQSVTTRINLKAFLDNPPPSLRAFLPTLLVVDENGEFVFGLQNYPDTTFGGLFPDGLPLATTEAAARYAAGEATYADLATFAFSFS